MIAAFPLSAFGQYAPVTRGMDAWVVQVVDGDALQVRLEGSGAIALVRLAGIDTLGRADAIEYATSALLGRIVQITLDPEAPRLGRWTPVYVTINNRVINRELVRNGFARVDEAYRGISLYGTLLNDEARARALRIGLWEDPTAAWLLRPGLIAPGIERVNINTATAARLNQLFRDVEAAPVGSAIVRFREDSPFQTVEELKFAGVLTREEFEQYRHLLTVSTNINGAPLEELQQLLGITSSAARGIERHREQFGGFAHTDELAELGLISLSVLQRNRSFIDVYDVTEIFAAAPNVIVDINEATQAELQQVYGRAAAHPRR
jgi:DNA uptake protein ComE-like DNA-binding protein/endonuclease YncB( thermonuclease family)